MNPSAFSPSSSVKPASLTLLDFSQILFLPPPQVLEHCHHMRHHSSPPLLNASPMRPHMCCLASWLLVSLAAPPWRPGAPRPVLTTIEGLSRLRPLNLQAEFSFLHCRRKDKSWCVNWMMFCNWSVC
jgi:hypothetical protein